MGKRASFGGIFKYESAEKAQYTLLGIPYDAASSFRPGARLAPTQIRQMAESLPPCTERGLDLQDVAARDAGDLALNNRLRSALTYIETAVGEILDDGAVPILLGGDHIITLPAFTATLRRHPGLKLLVFDAHPDLYEEFNEDAYSHACVTARIIELEGMEAERITQVGVRALTPEQITDAEHEGVRIIPAWDIDVFELRDPGPYYVSIDIDVLDPAYAPGCGNPVPGGPSTRELFALLQSLKAEIVAFDVVEVNPLLDPSGVTALTAARIVTEMLGVLEQRRRLRISGAK
jgi:agmatinase